MVVVKIGFASNDWSRTVKDENGIPVMGGSGYARLGQYMPHLLEQGVDAVHGRLAFNTVHKIFGVNTFTGEDHFDLDVIVLQRYMHVEALRDVKIARASGQIVLQDVDDWYWGLSKHNRAFKASHPEFNKSENTEHYKEIIRASNGVIASTRFLVDRISQWNSNVLEHTNYVDRSRFSMRKHENPESGKFVVGWIGSTEHRSGDLRLIRGVSSQISEFATWHHSGHIENPMVKRFEREIRADHGAVTRTSFVPPNHLSEAMRFDVGIVPLTDIPFNEAKSSIKGMEYAASGIPFVASRMAEYERLQEEHGIGVLVKRAGQFPAALKKFRDPEYRQEVGEKYREASKGFDAKDGAVTLVDTIRELTANA